MIKRENVKKAFVWIVSLLRQQKITFRISGGLAANIYGSKRPLADIDIEVYDEDVFKLREAVAKFVIYEPGRYKDNEFDLLLMTLKYKGQEIDICGVESQKLFNKKEKEWEPESSDLRQVTRKKVFGLIVPVIPLKALICYKQKIARDVDIQDVCVLLQLIT